MNEETKNVGQTLKELAVDIDAAFLVGQMEFVNKYVHEVEDKYNDYSKDGKMSHEMASALFVEMLQWVKDQNDNLAEEYKEYIKRYSVE